MLDIASIEIFVNLSFSEILKFTVNDGNYKYILSILDIIRIELLSVLQYIIFSKSLKILPCLQVGKQEATLPI